VTFVDKNDKIKILEYERFVKKRYAMYSDRFDNRVGIGSNPVERENFINYVKSQLKADNIKTILYNELSNTDIQFLSSKFPGTQFIKMAHHTSHAASGYYTSPFDKALIISIDGGGDEFSETVYTKTFLANAGELQQLKNYNIDFGGPYSLVGSPISEIKPGPDSNSRSLAYAGKVMGICAYGKVRDEWITPFKTFYRTKDLRQLQNAIGLNLSFNALKDNDSYDLAATSQFVFEEYFFETFWNDILESRTDVILVGGCALNVLLNQRLKERLNTINKQLFVPANPNDSGLSFGQFLHYTKIKLTENVVYNGFNILDISDFDRLKTTRPVRRVDEEEVVQLLQNGKIIGIINDGSEIGPRALGNRSIICNPTYKNMKDILNQKVKFREWFRPFAPVARFEDMNVFFDNAFESKFMSYAPVVKPEYRETLSSITHVDGTARLQTVTNEDHPLFYKLLTEMKKKNLIPIILNTSFNIRGYPILTTIKDALYVLDNTELDYVYTNGYLFSKT
jgi:carbamoyltransferase